MDNARMNPGQHRGIGQTRILGYTSLGGALEYYNFIIFVFFAKEIGQVFFPPGIPDWLREAQVYGLFAAGYLARPLGGMLMAHFGDRSGRRGMFVLSVLLMALPALLMSVLPSYDHIGIAAPLLLLLLRLVQGVAIGGEVPGGWIFVAEHVDRAYCGLACGVISASLEVGILTGSLIATLINAAFLPADVVGGLWRLPFLLGGVFGLLAALLRYRLAETPVFLSLQRQRSQRMEIPLGGVMLRHRREVLESMVLTWLLATCVLVLILMLPNLLLQRFGTQPAPTLLANSLAIVCLIAGSILAGGLTDQWGIRATLVSGAAGLAVCQSWLFASLAQGSYEFMLPYALSGFFAGVIGAIPLAMIRRFPAELRYSGMAFSYNLSYAICGVVSPFLVNALLEMGRGAVSAYFWVVCAAAVMAGWRQTR